MLIPVYEDELDEYEECTYELIAYELEGECNFFLSEGKLFGEQVELVTSRGLEELTNSGLVFVRIRGDVYSLEDTLDADMSDFVGEEIFIECC